MKLAVAAICSAFSDATIGTRVTDPQGFLPILEQSLVTHPRSHDRVPGQHMVRLPSMALPFVSAGLGLREHRGTNCYVVREHRGRVGAYLGRRYAARAESVSAVVYTIDAYRKDPEVGFEEVARMIRDGVTHVIVAVLAQVVENPSLTPGRFVSNLAGGNREAETWTADEIRAKAVEVNDYSNRWAVVAD